ncbi:MAG: DNA gyrase subunit A [bacterium]|nr:DNA gyrase subunit A [bacterium]
MPNKNNKKSSKSPRDPKEPVKPIVAAVEDREITEELRESYLDYSMSVIVSRALPDVRDGLKPVQRRILWGMWDSGATAGTKFRKSANIVGEVMGRYHPHGDSAIYDTMVRLAQDFSLRYPLVEGQGNFGSIDGDNAAAMRYTESRLSKIADEMLFDIDKETVDWQPNYDGARQEPKVLPSKLPNLLLNGAVGIAVGMATNIPPHNLSELLDAIVHLIDSPKATAQELTQFVQGPDFPTGGIIYDKKAIAEAYVTGKGPVTIRAVAEVKEKNKSHYIEVTEIPYQVNKSELLIKIAGLVQEKRIVGIRDVRDESDRKGLSIVIELKNDAAPQRILNQLYKFTDLQKDFHFNLIALQYVKDSSGNNGLQPRLMSLKDILAAFVEHRREVVVRRAQFDLKKAEERAHILMGLAKALSVIDKIIATIKKSSDKDEAHKNLVKNFKLSPIQATAILEMKLQTLAALERQKIEDELKEKRKLIAELQLLLKSPQKILKVVKDEIAEIKNKYGDERRTRVVAGGIKDFKEEDLVPKEDAVISLSKGGYIKRLPPATFHSQGRGGKGLIGSEVGEGDFIASFMDANTHDNILFFTDRGRVFQTKVYEIPPATRTSKGKPVHNFLQVPLEEKISAMISYPDTSQTGSMVMVTRNGMIKKTILEDFKNVRRSGIIAISLKKGDMLKEVMISNSGDELMLTTSQGQSIRFKESQIRKMGRTASGVRGMRLKKDDVIASADIISSDKTKDKNLKLLVVMGNGFGKLTPLSQYRLQSRGGSGIKTAKITSKTGELISAHLIDQQTELLALSAKGQIIRTDLTNIRTASRDTQGVKIMTLKPGDKLTGVICL